MPRIWLPSSAICRATCIPASPVQALAFPELTMMALISPPDLLQVFLGKQQGSRFDDVGGEAGGGNRGTG